MTRDLREKRSPSGQLHGARLGIAAAWLGAVAAASGQTTPLVHEGLVAAPVERVWAAFTTGEGLRSWMAPHAEFDLRIGGKMRSNYNKEGRLGDAATIENTVLAYEPQRMLTIKATRAPEGFPFKEAIKTMWTVLYFEPQGPDRTRLRMVSMGFTGDEESQKMRKHFDWGNAYTLKKLQEKFASPATRPAGDALELARRLVGGEWQHESRPAEGRVFRLRNVAVDGPDGRSVILNGWLGDAQGLQYHAATHIFREPGSQRIVFHNLTETGAWAQGELWAAEAERLEWDWNAQALDGSMTHYRVIMAFEGTDRYRMALLRVVDGQWKQQFELPFERKATPAAASRATTRPAAAAR